MYTRNVRPLLTLLYASLAIALPLSASAQSNHNSDTQSHLVEYKAHYHTRAMGLEIDGERELSKLANGQYQLLNGSQVMFYSIREKSLFSVEANGQLQTQQYAQIRKGVGSNKSIEQHWDWSKKNVTSHYKGKDYQYAIKPGSLDRLNYQLALRRDAQRLGKDFGSQHYPVAGRHSLRDDFVVTYRGEEVLDTPIGPFNAVKFERRKDADESTSIWLAKDWHYMILKLTHCEKKSCEDVQLSDAIVDGKKMTALPASTRK